MAKLLNSGSKYGDEFRSTHSSFAFEKRSRPFIGSASLSANTIAVYGAIRRLVSATFRFKF
jgi:hypothetical protein